MLFRGDCDARRMPGIALETDAESKAIAGPDKPGVGWQLKGFATQ
jgi:hypothetical protein